MLGSTAGEKGSAQVVVDNPAKAKKALSAAGFTYLEGTLDQVELPNKPGALADCAAKLAKKGINIDAAYGSVSKGAKKSVLFSPPRNRLVASEGSSTITDGFCDSQQGVDAGYGEVSARFLCLRRPARIRFSG